MREYQENKAGAPDLRWLLAGAFAGLLAAGYGILRQADPGGELPVGAVARINEQIITRDQFDRAVTRLGISELSEDDSARILRRMVEDELLVQRGIELGMAQSETTVRSAIVDSLVASVTAEADAASPTDEELQQHLEDNPDRFSYTAKLSVSAWQTDDEPVAQTFITALRDDGETPVSDAIGPIPDLPPELVPVEALREYLGPGIAAAASEMPEGSSAIFARRGRWLVVQVLGKESAVITDLDMVRNRVLLDYRRFLADEALQNYLDDLQRRADVEMVQP